MIPSRFQLPPRPLWASLIVSGGPPEASIFFNLPLAKNPRNRLSGDQNGHAAPSVPASGCAEIAASGRTKSMRLPSASDPAKATRLPSGESAIAPEPKANCTFSGGRIEERKTRGGSGLFPSIQAARATAATVERRAQTAQSRSRLRRRATTDAGRPTCEPLSAIHWSWSRTSCAVWKRSSASLERQVFTTWSRAGGVIGWTVEIGGGSVWRIAPIVDAWLVPENAF